MQITLDMPSVMDCDAVRCAYNNDGSCRARAITVGDGAHAACDTYLVSNGHARRRGSDAGVGACKVSSCTHNVDYACEASSIRVGSHDDHADCMTFETP